MKFTNFFLIFLWCKLKVSFEQLPLLVPFQEECVDVDRDIHFKRIGKVLRNTCFWECYKIKCRYIHVGGRDKGKDDCYISHQTFHPKVSGGCMVSRMFTKREYQDLPIEFQNCSMPNNVITECVYGYDGVRNTTLYTGDIDAWLYFSFEREVLIQFLYMYDSEGYQFSHRVYISSESMIFDSDGKPDYYNKLTEVPYTYNQQINQQDKSIQLMYMYTEDRRLCARHLVIRAYRNVINIKIDSVRGYIHH
ncbi:UNVERIFIED_CONTAM: hypothetical protein RMT77_019128 [Armadillidium vulgare]